MPGSRRGQQGTAQGAAGPAKHSTAGNGSVKPLELGTCRPPGHLLMARWRQGHWQGRALHCGDSQSQALGSEWDAGRVAPAAISLGLQGQGKLTDSWQGR